MIAARIALALTLGALTVRGFAEEKPAPSSVLVVIGARGSDAFAEPFAQWGRDWEKAAQAGNVPVKVIGADPQKKDSAIELKRALEAEDTKSAQPLWIALLGHGSIDGKEPKFNLAGDDLSVSEFASWLQPFQRPVVIVAGFSASGAWLKPLTGKDRVVITATKSGSENNYARFGGFYATAIGDPAADLDHDGQTSALEAWLSAAQRVAEFYESEGRLATEHSLLDDNGDGLGTPPDWFEGVRAVKKASGKAEVDGLRAHQLHLIPSTDERALPPELRAERDALELELAQLRAIKASLPEKEYLAQLEKILIRLARLYQEKAVDPSS